MSSDFPREIWGFDFSEFESNHLRRSADEAVAWAQQLQFAFDKNRPRYRLLLRGRNGVIRPVSPALPFQPFDYYLLHLITALERRSFIRFDPILERGDDYSEKFTLLGRQARVSLIRHNIAERIDGGSKEEVLAHWVIRALPFHPSITYTLYTRKKFA